MASRSSNFIIIIISTISLIITAVHSSSTDLGDQTAALDLQWLTTLPSTSTTSFSSSGSCPADNIGECLEEEEEFQMESAESHHRRMLFWRRYISYGALRRNYVPCSRRGASYYNCRPGASANPYHRGCSRITRCRR